MQAAKPKKSPARAKSAAAEDVVAIAKATGDERRANLLRLLQHDSFAVSELAQVFGVAQPAISHHLKVLRQAGLISQRKEGNSIYYRRCDPSGSALIQALFAALDRSGAPAAMQRRVETVHRQRQRNVQEFFANNADALKSQRMLISETEVYADALQEIWRNYLTSGDRALEVGPGDTQIIERLAGDFSQVLAVDSSKQMLNPVRQAASKLANVALEQIDFAKLKDNQFDLIVAAMVLHHQPSPRSFFASAKRCLKPGGLLLIAELDRHQHDWVRDACGDLWLGFTPEELDGWADSVGLKNGTHQFLAQRNGFSIQLTNYVHKQN